MISLQINEYNEIFYKTLLKYKLQNKYFSVFFILFIQHFQMEHWLNLIYLQGGANKSTVFKRTKATKSTRNLYQHGSVK